MKKIYLKHASLAAAWLLFLGFGWQLYNLPSPQVTIVISQLTEEQQVVYDEIMASRKESSTSPRDRNVLSQSEQVALAKVSVIESPNWIFWKETMYVKEYDGIIFSLYFGFAAGIIVAFVMSIMRDSRLKVYLLVPGSVLATVLLVQLTIGAETNLPPLLFGLVIVLTGTTVFELAKASRQLWYKVEPSV